MGEWKLGETRRVFDILPIQQTSIVVISIVIAGNSMSLVTVGEAADRLKVSTQTVKRRLKNGTLKGEQKDTPQGYIWLVDISEAKADTSILNEDTSGDTLVAISREMQRLEQMVEILQRELEHRDGQLEAKDKQIEQLHVLLQQAQAVLPDPRNKRPWWRRMWQRD
jgi:predicted amino acid-binding ACT domain protein